MKKGICFLLAGAMILSQTACSGGKTSQPDTQPDSTSETETITTNDNSLNTNDEEPEETPEQQRISKISILSWHPATILPQNGMIITISGMTEQRIIW